MTRVQPSRAGAEEDAAAGCVCAGAPRADRARSHEPDSDSVGSPMSMAALPSGRVGRGFILPTCGSFTAPGEG